ncbi:MAG: RNA polymerase sigma factor [Bacteroidota bacterium]
MEQNELIAGLKSHDEEAFKVLVEQFKDRIYNLCYSYVRNAAESEDLAQEVFIEVYNSIGRFNEKADLSTWIYRITINEALQMIRKKKAQKRFGFVFSLFGNEEKYSSLHKEEVHPGVSLENRERSRVLFSQIDKLAENQKNAFLLIKLEGKSYQEVADIMQTTVSSVESLMHRAKANLKKWLGSYYKTTEL